RALAERGTLSVVLITHKFREVMRFAQDVTVMRAGRILATTDVASTSIEELARRMFGQAAATTVANDRRAATSAAVYCEVRDLSAQGDRGTLTVVDTSFTVRGGEILAVAGVSGNGQKELVEVLAGQRDAADGVVLVAGRRYRRTRSEMQRYGVFVLTEEPLANDCVRSLSVMANLALRRYDRPPIAWHGWIRRRILRRWAEGLIARYRIRTSSPLARIDSLSGGNVQRTVLARELSEDVRLLILQNPCFGLDAAAAAEIRAQIAKARDRGVAVLLVSEDLDEVLELSDRIVVMSGGRIVHEVDRAHADRYELGRHMTRTTDVEAA
ncbi:MAG TPA: ATP-binding cassette domain-containing protein, partial [Casimicrobiaceae bacterium]|nr:ATP-binding cassette domain-containing protein [Casimicrobiaceae bacterium]